MNVYITLTLLFLLKHSALGKDISTSMCLKLKICKKLFPRRLISHTPILYSWNVWVTVCSLSDWPSIVLNRKSQVLFTPDTAFYSLLLQCNNYLEGTVSFVWLLPCLFQGVQHQQMKSKAIPIILQVLSMKTFSVPTVFGKRLSYGMGMSSRPLGYPNHIEAPTWDLKIWAPEYSTDG